MRVNKAMYIDEGMSLVPSNIHYIHFKFHDPCTFFAAAAITAGHQYGWMRVWEACTVACEGGLTKEVLSRYSVS